MNLLINPTDMIHSKNTRPPSPLGALYVASTDPDTVIYDAAVRGKPDEFLRQNKPEVVGITMYTMGRKEALRILRVAKDVGARTVAGGPHVGLMLKQLQTNYDFVDHWVVGDGEWIWRDLCEGQDPGPALCVPVQNLDDLPMPAWDRLDITAYGSKINIVLGRGCIGHCDFCSTWWVQGRYRHHGKDWMAAHLDLLWRKDVRHLIFQDDCLTAFRDAALDLCDTLAKYDFTWRGTTRVDTVDPELAERMKSVGCYKLAFGIEHGSPRMLKSMRKHATPDQALQARKVCQDAGISFAALMMVGYPGETDEDRRVDREFRMKLKPDEWGSMGYVLVLPGTALYRRCRDADLIDGSFWLGDEPYYIYRGGLDE